MEQNNHTLYRELMQEIELANDEFLSATIDLLNDLTEKHMDNVKSIVRQYLPDEEETETDDSLQEQINASLLSQSIRAQLDNPIAVVAPVVAEENEELTEHLDEDSLSTLIANQLDVTPKEPVSHRNEGSRSISSIIEELKRSVNHTIDQETDALTEEIIVENLSTPTTIVESEENQVSDLSARIKAELLSQQIKKQLQ